MIAKKFTVEEVLELCARLTEAEAAMLESYGQSNPPKELTKAWETLWDCCQEYQTTFENFSHN